MEILQNLTKNKQKKAPPSMPVIHALRIVDALLLSKVQIITLKTRVNTRQGYFFIVK